MGHDQRLHHHRLHPTSRHCSASCRRHARLRNAGARRALFCPPFDPAALRPLPREESGLLRGRRGIYLCRFVWEDCKGECYAFTRKASATDTKKDKVPVLLSFLPNETALVTDSEDDSDANETFHDAETMPGEAHASMPPSPLSPRRTCASGPNPSRTRTSTNHLF